MFYKWSRMLVGIAVLLAALLPMQFSSAMQNSKTGGPNCPPMDASMLKVPGYLRSLPAECRELKTSAAAPFAQSMSALLTSGGPDDFGYTYDDTVPFNWISATLNTGVQGDASYPPSFFDIGFVFPFYGLNYSQLSFSTKGYITFDPASVCCFFFSTPIPISATPNNMIAAFWDDVVVGAGFNSGAIYYDRGGVAPNRYFVLEWRDVTLYVGSEPFSFEAILYENGDVLIQHQSLPDGYYSAVGIENGIGDDGLQYHFGNAPLSAPKAIKFYYPSDPVARVSVTPRGTGQFASTDANTNFPIHISNIGSAGADSYNLAVTSAWAATLYQDGCVTPLTDTNADTVIDTGPLAQGASTTICVSFATPPGASVGDSNPASMIVSSSLDPTKSKDVSLSMAISTTFVQVLEDYENAAMAFQINGPEGPTTNYVTDDFYFANGLATMRMPDGRYIYAWRKPAGNYPDSHSNIEFTLLNSDGSFSLPVTEITNNFGTGQTYDYAPAVAVAPNGNIGVTWYRWIVDNSTGLFNYNIYFAMLSNEGDVLFPPTRVTDNDLYDQFDDLDVPHYFSPAIAATDDNRFILAWQDFRSDGISIFMSDLWHTERESDGTSLIAPTRITFDGSSIAPILNSLTGNDAILTYISGTSVSYIVVNSSGLLSAPQSIPGAFSFAGADAVMLPNGSTAVAWTGLGVEVGYAMLDASYNVSSAVMTPNPDSAYNRDMSVTFDSSNHVIMTWADADGDIPTHLFYALANESGSSFITPPQTFLLSTIGFLDANGVITSANGQGNAPLLTSEPPVLNVNIDIVPTSPSNTIASNSLFVQVAILSSDGFNAVSEVNRSSLTFGHTGNESSLVLCLKNGRDPNQDGRPDLICYFSVSLSGLVVGDTQAILRGSTVSGIPFESSDSVRVSNRSK